MTTINYYMDDNGGCYVEGTVNSFAGLSDLNEWAEENEVELNEVSVPEDFDSKIENGAIVW